MSCHHPYSVFEYFLRGSCSGMFSSPPLDPEIGFGLYLVLFAFTGLFEWPWYRKPMRVLVLNLLTHPLVVWVGPSWIRTLGGGYGVYVITAELFAPLVEAVALHWIWRVPRGRALALALGANLFSWCVGGEVVNLWLWPLIRRLFGV